VGAARPQRNMTTKKCLEKKYGEGNVDTGPQVQLDADKDGNAKRSRMETSGLYLVLQWE